MGLRRAILASLAIAAVVPLAFAAIMFPLTVDVPQYDEWSRIPLLEAHYEHRPVLPLILQPYNGHIIAVPRAILLVTAVATHWNLRAEILLCYFVAFITSAVLVLMLRDSGPHALLLAAPIVMMVFSFMNFAVFLSAFPLCEHLCLLGLVVMIYTLTRPVISGRHVATAMLAASVATFSWGGGIVVWPIGAAALLARSPRRWGSLMTWCGLAVAAGFIVRSHAGPLPAASHMLTHSGYWIFVAAAVGKPLSWRMFPDLHWAFVAGAILLFVAAVVYAWTWTTGRRLTLLRWGLFGAAAVAMAVTIAAARGPTPSQALAPHYAMMTFPLFVSTLVLAFQAVAERAEKRLAYSIAALLLAAIPVRELFLARECIPVLRGWSRAEKQAAQKLLAGKATGKETDLFHPDATLLRHGLEVMQRHRLGPYRNSPD